MKVLVFFIWGICNFFQVPYSEIRTDFQQAALSEEEARYFYEQTLKLKEDNSKNRAYQGAALATLAKFEKGIKNKKEYVKEGILLIERAIEQDPNSVELRMIRLIIQENVPKIVKYNRDIEQDKNWIVEHYKKQDKELKTWIQSYASQSTSFTNEDREKML